MKIGIMQPYFFPYLGYWQLMNAVDKYIIYDDVAYIKQGWINRNFMLLNGQKYLFTVPVTDASSFKNINQLDIASKPDKLLRTIEQGYAKAPFFGDVYPLVQSVINYPEQNLAKYVVNSMHAVAKYLKIETELLLSSEMEKDNTLKGQDKVLHICQKMMASEYYNASGGQELYSREVFLNRGILLKFLKSKPVEYKQFKNDFIPWLSVLDVMMFNSITEIRSMLEQYELQ